MDTEHAELAELLRRQRPRERAAWRKARRMQRQADARTEAVFDRLFVVLPSRPYTEEWAMGRDCWWALLGELGVHGRPGRKRYAWALRKAAAARGATPHRHLKGMPPHAKRWNLAIRVRPRAPWEPT